MARIRDLKPSFFRNEQLAEQEHWVRLLFQGLWGIADREGRLEDRAKRIGADVFPYEQLPIDEGLTALAAAGFIHRYTVGAVRVIQIVNFTKHQKPHPKEAASELPSLDQVVTTQPGIGAVEPGKETASPGNPGTGNAFALALGDSLPLGNGVQGGAPSVAPGADAPPPLVKSKRVKREKVTFADWADSIDPPLIPPDDPVFAYAKSVGIPREFIVLAFAEFDAKYADDPSARQKDWRAAFRTHVRRGWLKLWWFDGNTCQLTTAGVQAQRARKAAA